MTIPKNHDGMQFNRLTAIKEAPRGDFNKRAYLFKCVCGQKVVRRLDDVKGGKTKSCGCLNREYSGKPASPNARHRNPLYAIWNNMMGRCYNPNSTSYPNYGAKGITVCKRWHKFELFCLDMGERPSLKHSLDRKKNHIGYRKSNCRWATKKEQARNRTDNHIITIGGVSKPVCEWSEIYGIRSDTIIRRIAKYGYTPSDAVTTKASRNVHERKK